MVLKVDTSAKQLRKYKMRGGRLVRRKKRAPGIVVGSNRQGKTMIRYSAPNNVPFPDVFYDKFRTEALFSISHTAGANPAAFTSTGVWAVRIKAIDIISPFTNLGAVAAVGGSGTSLSIPLDSTRLINANVYSSYQVVSTTIEFTCLPQNPLDTMFAALMPSNNAAPATYAQSMLEKDTVARQFRTNVDTKPLRITVYWNKFFGVDKVVYENDQLGLYSASYAATPLAVAFIDVFLQQVAGIAPANDVGCRLKMTQNIKMWGFTQQV